MILFQAIRLDAYDRFQYRIDRPGDASLLIAERSEAIDLLKRFGVAEPTRLVDHVEVWGSVEMPDHPSDSP